MTKKRCHETHHVLSPKNERARKLLISIFFFFFFFFCISHPIEHFHVKHQQQQQQQQQPQQHLFPIFYDGKTFIFSKAF